MFIPLHLQAGNGSRFAIFHPAQGDCVGLAVYLHPLAEEMNKARRMAALQARALAAKGLDVLQIDLLGCGDSSGNAKDSTWAAWQDDTLLAAQWLRHRHPGRSDMPLWLWGLRSGALLASSTAQERAQELGPCNFLFWQPAQQGKILLQQFLRLVTASQMIQSLPDTDAGAHVAATKKPGTEQLRARLRQGQTLEVAGYQLSPGLALGLESTTLDPPTVAMKPDAPRRMLWLETSPRADPALAPASQTALERWRQAGYRVQAHAVRGPNFWQTTEIEDAPALLEATCQLLASDATAAATECA